MAWTPKGDRGQKIVAEHDVKICELCGTLNYHTNDECYICAWHGAFNRDTALIHAAWLRLHDQFEGVRIEHVTPHRLGVIGHLGEAKKATRWQAFQAAVKQRWDAFQAAREARMREREAAYRPRHATPPNELGV